MDWLVVTEDYLKHLRKKDKRIPFSEYGEKKYKPFFGILFETEDFYYITQISHAQKRHKNMKNGKDFKKIYNPKDNRLLAVINLNYMFPIPKSLKNVLKYKNIDTYRKFDTDKEKSKYINLLKTEKKVLNQMNLEKSAKLVYENKYLTEKQDIALADRCIDFKFMEKLAKEYIGNKIKLQEQ
uniref:Toxin ToxN, type III toxin-antitoxin system n=1 Tax=Siphoviridae sp. ctJLl6 TaxID=2827836 RepID=A0A8S5SAV7_9CAUD|nr:MAG TPA: Toxin ToxN, type III toxin-antitoxin system [Siphoviridae sp. ctJLl6]